MQILIIEQYNHFKVLENTYHLLVKHYSPHFYINKDRSNNKEMLFPSSKSATVIINPAHLILFYIWPLLNGWKYKYINISTGPECSDYWEFFNVVFFYLFCLMYGNRIILTIKNTRSYLKSTSGLFSFIRNRAIKKINKLVFETKTMGEIFRENERVENCKISAVYDRYTDLLDNDTSRDSLLRTDNKIRIGLLGMIDPLRRDYDVIYEVIRSLSENERSLLQFVTLGACEEGANNKIIRKLQEYVEIDLLKGWISTEEFDIRGTSCDLLIAPLKESMEYGTYKGSGSLGDAVYLRRKTILPSHVDSAEEFKEIAVYYNNEKELLGILRNAKELSQDKVADRFYEKFTTKNVYNNLIKDLGCEKKR